MVHLRLLHTAHFTMGDLEVNPGKPMKRESLFIEYQVSHALSPFNHSDQSPKDELAAHNICITNMFLVLL